MDNLNQKLLSTAILPLPSVAEQRVIVERVEKLLNWVDDLEMQVKERRGQVEGLKQAVLGEVFEGENAKI
jgi:restriction endonuclease S subunit